LGGFVEENDNTRGGREIGSFENWEVWFVRRSIEWEINLLETKVQEAREDYLTDAF